MRRLTPLWSAMLLAMACSQAQAMDLTEAIQSTLANHPELQADINSRLTADAQAKMAKAGYLPTVDLMLGYGREHVDSPTTRGLTHNTETLSPGDAELRLRQALVRKADPDLQVGGEGQPRAVVGVRAGGEGLWI